jgi:3-(3-hydroxy-phenyl)propionate hydroxylase
MEEIGIMDRLAPEALLDTGARYFGRKDQLIAEVRPAGSRLGRPGKSQFDQPVLDALLLDAARTRPGITLMFNTEVSHVENVDDGVVASLASGDSVKAQWLVACDGGKSPVRSQFNVKLIGSTQVQKWIVLDIINSKLAPEHFAEFHCNGTRPVVVVPGVNGRRRYEFMLLPGETEERVTSNEFIMNLVQPYEKIQASDIRRAAVYVAHQRVAADYRIGRVLLVGDAAHLMPPFAGQALNAGVRDAANVAWKLAAILKDGAAESLINTYAEERRPHAADMVRLSHRIGKVVMSTNSFGTAFRDGFIKATGLVPPLKRWITGMKFLKQPHYTSGCLVTNVPGAPKQVVDLVGRSLSQPKVEKVKGDAIPLDTLLGTGWVSLRFEGDGQFVIAPLTNGTGTITSDVTVHDTEELFGAVPAGISLIVRPDRYVAAAVPTEKEALALAKLGEYVPELVR